jgi:hypothetical protein
MGGLGGGSEVLPGQVFEQSVPLMRHVHMPSPGEYVVRISHDLGWSHPPDVPAAVAEARIRFRMPTPEEAEQGFAGMLALPEPGVGLLPAGCGTQNLPWLVGEGWAKRMILTNERVDAAAALRIGLVQEVVEKGQSLAAATVLAERVATLSPRSVEYCKALIHNARNGIPRRAGLALERERFMDLFDYDDRAEGVKAFLEKRKPEWKND